MRPLLILASILAFTLLSLCSTAVWADDDLDGVDYRAAEPEPRLAIGIDPVGLLGGTYALSGTYVVGRRIGIRSDITIQDEQPMLPDSGSWRASVNLPIYLDRPFHGPYVEPGLALAHRFMGYASIGLLGGTPAEPPMVVYYQPQHAESIEPQMFVGWSWLYRSRLSLAAAIGVARHFATDGSGTSYAAPESYLRVGLAL